MAKLYFEIEADYRKVIKLREEIEKLQRTMRTFGSHTSVDEIKELESKLKALRTEYDTLTEKAAKSAVTLEKSGISFGKALAAVGGVASLKLLGSEIIRVRGEFQEMETAIETLVGKRMSDKLLPQIKELAKVSPLTMTDIVGAEKMMLGFNIEADKTIGFLKALSDVSMGSSQKFNSLTLAFSQMSAAGKLMGQDLNQMINAGFNPLQQISLTTGKSIAVLKEEMSKGAISAEMVQKAFMDATSAGGKFYKMSENASKTINGQLSMMEDAWDSALNEMGQKTEGIIMSGIQATTSLIQNYETIGKVLLSLVSVYGVYKAALLTNIVLEKVQAVQRLSSIKGISTMTMLTDILTKKTAALNLVTKASPWWIAAASVTALAIGTYKLFTYQTDLEKSTQKLNQEVSKEQRNIDDLFGKLDAAKEGTEDYETAKQEIINQYGSYLNGLRDEVATLKDVEAAYLAVSAAAKLSAQERAIASANEKTNSDYNSRKENIFGEISGLFQGNKRASSSVLAAIQKDFARLGDGNISKQTEEEIKKYKDVGDQILRQISFIKAYRLERDKTFEGNRKNFDEWGVLSMSESELSKRIESVKNLRKQMEDSGKEGNLVTSSRKMVFNSLHEIDSYLSALEVRSAKITEGRKEEKTNEGDTYTEAYKKAEKRWKDATKAVEDAKKKSQKEYEAAVQELDSAESEFKKLGGDTTGKGKKESDKESENAQRLSEELLSIRRKNQQDEINLMKEGSEKKVAQIELDYQKEMDAIERQRQEWKKAQGGTLTDEQHEALGMSIVLAEDTRNNGLAKVEQEDTEAAKKAMNDYLKEYGTYLQKREAIINDYNERINKAATEGERLTLGEEMKRELAEIDEAAQGATSIITQLFEDMSDKTIAEMREIADEAETILAYLKSGQWVEVKDESGKGTGKDAFGFTKELFDTTRNDPEKVKAIGDGIKEVRDKADEAEPIFKKMGKAFKGLFSDEKNFDENISTIIEGVGQVNQAMEFLGGTLSQISDAFGGNFLGGIAEGIGVATEAVNGAMSGAQAGAVFGPWGAAAGAAIGLVGSLTSSLSALHDKKHEKTIQRIQGQIEVLEKTYDKLGDEIEKAYSKDASGLIEDQNKLLEQQKVLIQQQIREEEEKKKTDNNRIKEWKEQIEEINKTIEDNKEAAVDAIFGSDLQSAIEDFASAYVEAWSAGEDKAKSAKDMVKTMIKNMVTESIKAAASDPMKAIREKLLSFWSDEYISGWEQDYLNKMATDLQKELDSKFGWADSFMNDSSYSQEASSKGFQAMSQDTGEELNGRFTALQIAGEEIRNHVSIINMTTSELKAINTGIRDSISGIQDQIASSYLELVAINENTGASAKYLKDIKNDIAEVKENTKRL